MINLVELLISLNLRNITCYNIHCMEDNLRENLVEFRYEKVFLCLQFDINGLNIAKGCVTLYLPQQQTARQ